MDIISILLLCCVLDIATAICDQTTCEICKGDGNKCSSCKPGYFLDGVETCSKCSDMCLICSAFTICDQCADRSYKYTATDGNSYCIVCPNDCTSCTNDTHCTRCDTGYYGVMCAHACQDHCVDGECTIDGCTRGCVDGQYKDRDNVCKVCLTSCKTCSNSRSCDTCERTGTYGSDCVDTCIDTCPDSTCDISTGRCATTCAEGQYMNQEGYCVACSSPCKACVTTGTTCTECDGGHYLDGKICKACYEGCDGGCTGAVLCNSCKDGYYRVFHGCAPCSATCATCTQSNQCTSCTQEYQLISGQCCLPTCAKCSSSDHCTSCYPGYYMESQQCHQCSATCATCASYSHCTSCRDGYYLTSKQQCFLCSHACATCTTYDNCISCKYGYNLESQLCYQCSSECMDRQCDSNAECMNGCTSSDRFGPKCDKLCTETLLNCLECDIKDTVVKCLQCNTSYQLVNNKCEHCSTECNNQLCDNDGNCENGCSSIDRYGPKCDRVCKDSFQNCSECNTTATPVHCVSCETGFRLETGKCVPNIICPECKDGTCDTDGNCTNGCLSTDKYGPTCDQSCTSSFPNCSSCNTAAPIVYCVQCITGYHIVNNTCAPNISCSSDCEGRQCDSDGNCTNGCSSKDMYGPKCDKSCKDSVSNCSSCNATTEPIRCVECIAGYHLADNKCEPCSLECKGNQCDSDGDCSNGCSSSDRYGPQCDKSCSGTFQHCFECNINEDPVTCSACQAGHILHSGSCHVCPSECKEGCSSGDGGITCKHDEADPFVSNNSIDTNVAALGGAVGGGFVLIALVIFLCIVIRKKREKPPPENGEAHATFSAYETVTDPADLYAKPIKRRGNVSMSISGPVSSGKSPMVRLSTTSERSFSGSQVNDTGTRMSEGCIAITTSSPAVLYSKPIKRRGNDSRARSGLVSFGKLPAVLDDGAHVEEERISDNITPVIERKQTPDMYYNMAGMIRSRIAVDELQEFVSKKTNQDFMKEFMKLPDGLTRPYDAAMLNRENNRYRMIYPYDASRVVLKSGPTDYINASHIDCYSQYNTYIASLGPTDKIMPGYESFWTMVWQEKVEVIVMLTNLMEGAAMKCEQYWPDCGSRMTYGDVTVTCHSEDVYAECTVRTFTVQQTERRTLHHIHYTAWPDKGVPDDVTSIIEFRQKVINFPNKLEGPTIVHCSAGIGRTGTYVALDILTREGRAEGTVDVFGCVAALRGQRVNLVQTAEQYEYLHNALVHSLTFDCEPIQANKVRQLLIPSHTSTIDAQFEQLNQTNDTLSEDEKADVAGNRVLLQKNRPGADIPGNKHRSWIQTQQTVSSEYINAVYVNSFKQRNRYIVAQTPLPTTVEDFLTLVIQTDCPCIVSLDENNLHDKTVGVYLPATNQVSTLGMFQVECITCETTPNYTLRQLVITALLPSGVKEHSVYHFQCTSWGMGDNVPRDAMTFLQMARDVERVVAGYKDTGPIIVHCLTGAERSGLFCVVSVLIQKMEIEHQEQYQFCHQCLAAYMQSFETFSSIPL